MEFMSESDMQSLDLTSDQIKKIFGASGDFISREFFINDRADMRVVLCYLDGMVNAKIIDDNIAFPLAASRWFENCPNLVHAFGLCQRGALHVSAVTAAEEMNAALTSMMAGKTLLVFDKLKKALILDTIGFEKRAVTAATEEETYRSGKDGFVETLRINTSMLRKKIKSPYLVLEETVVGRQTRTRVCLAYLSNICNDSFVEKVRSALGRIDQDKAMTLQDICSGVVGLRFTPFPTAIITEKPGNCCMSLLEGKVAVIADELPYAVVFPGLFCDLFQSASDYGYHFLIASFFRIIRYLCFFASLVLPGILVAVTTFHTKMLPYDLAASIAASRAGTPFHIYMEVLLMSLAFFVLIEASIQISKTIGGAISIVGGLVLGDAAIAAGLISPAVIVVVAAAAICSMAVPNKEANTAIWLFQLLCTLLGSLFGLAGVVMALLIVLFSLAKLEPMGVPYLSPFLMSEPVQPEDSFIRFPHNLIRWRPFYLDPKNKRRMRSR